LKKKIKKIRGEEPQSFRDLAVALARRGKKEDYEKSLQLLNDVVEGDWDIRFSQIEVVALMDLNRLLNMMKFKGFSYQNEQRFKTDKRFVNEMDVDLRVILCWDTDLINIELECEEWNGQKCNSFKNHTKNGGLLSKDFTEGYGPQEYVIRKAHLGKYTLKAKLFSPIIPVGDGIICICRIYTNFGRMNEKEYISVMRLSKPKEIFEIGQVEFP